MRWVVRGDVLILSEGDRVPAEVLATGPRSELGKIGVSLATPDSGKTGLERETARIVKLVAAFALALSAAMMLGHYLLRGDWIASVLAGLTLAMAILPEEFPVVLTVFLALGAWRISRDGVLTRRMPAIEMLGAATVRCVDKTGTLAENRMTITDAPPRVIDLAALASEIDPVDPMNRAIVAAASPAACACWRWPRRPGTRRRWRTRRAIRTASPASSRSPTRCAPRCPRPSRNAARRASAW